MNDTTNKTIGSVALAVGYLAIVIVCGMLWHNHPIDFVKVASETARNIADNYGGQ
jgi:hypothetical protein